MADPNDSPESKAAVKQPTDADLDSAYRDLIGGGDVEKKPVVEGEGKPQIQEGQSPEPDEQLERTRLGRRVKKMEGTLDEIRNFMQTLSGPASHPKPSEASGDEIPEFVSTPADVDKILDNRERRKIESQKTYETQYFKRLNTFSGEDPDFHEQIVDEMVKNQRFNQILTGNPDIDARTNYAEAKAHLLSQKMSKVRPNVRGGKPSVSTDLSISSHSDRSVPEDIQLDPVAAEFVKKVGMSKESVNKAFAGEMPVHLARSK